MNIGFVFLAFPWCSLPQFPEDWWTKTWTSLPWCCWHSWRHWKFWHFGWWWSLNYCNVRSLRRNLTTSQSTWSAIWSTTEGQDHVTTNMRSTSHKEGIQDDPNHCHQETKLLSRLSRESSLFIYSQLDGSVMTGRLSSCPWGNWVLGWT